MLGRGFIALAPPRPACWNVRMLARTAHLIIQRQKKRERDPESRSQKNQREYMIRKKKLAVENSSLERIPHDRQLKGSADFESPRLDGQMTCATARK